MDTTKCLIERLLFEKEHKINGGIYNKLQVDFAYNSNHIEGTKLTHEQTRLIFDTKAVSGDCIIVDDVIETSNHFRCFDFILNTYNDALSEEYIKTVHRILKNGLYQQDSDYSAGEYKKFANIIGDIETSSPESVSNDIKDLLHMYNSKINIDLLDIAIFHADFEKIHPFYDGNGRVGRLLILKECLKNDIVPFFVNDQEKIFYYIGLKEYQVDNKIERLNSFFLLMQDDMKAILNYFGIKYTEVEFITDPEIEADDNIDL